MLRSFQLKTDHPGALALRFMALIFFASLAGCSASRSHMPLAMMGASASPAARHTATVSQPTATETDKEVQAADYDFIPAFTATCRPDHQFTHLDLTLAFVDVQPSVTFDFLPMFGSTASPSARAKPVVLQVKATADADAP